MIRNSLLKIVPAAMAAAAFPAAPTGAEELPATTPPGVTLVEVMRELPISQPEILWVRPGDSEGRTLFTYAGDEPGRSACTGACAQEFPPLRAPEGAQPTGDWTLVRREDETLQWAYQSQPLYTWVKEQVPGEVATNVGLLETANQKFAENEVVAGDLLPPEGWSVARLRPAESMTLPVGVGVSLVNVIQAVALTDAEGHTLYTFDGKASEDGLNCLATGCKKRWIPAMAPALAKGIGDFTVVARKDGSKQWAYRNRPLYTWGGDKLPGDANGVGIDQRWSVAAVTENFWPDDVGVTLLEGYGAALTVNGMTLYGGYAFEKRWGGRNLRDTFTNVYQKGKRLGDGACTDAECLRTWKPFLAPDDAQPSGYWEPIVRADGRKQWAYKGYALYTYAGDRKPGDHYGQATYDFEPVEGEGFSFRRASYLEDISHASGGLGIYWNIAKP